MLSSGFPPFHEWTYLLIAAFVAYNFIIVREGKGGSRKVVINVLLAILLLAAALVFFALLIWPVVALTALVWFLSRLKSKDRLVRKISAGILLMFLGTAIFRFADARYQGKYWQLSRFHAGGPGQSWVSHTAKEGVFTDVELLRALGSKDETVGRNAESVLLYKVRTTDSPEELSSLEASMEGSSYSDGSGQLRSELEGRLKAVEAEQKQDSEPAQP